MPRAPDGIAAEEMRKAERRRELERSRKVPTVGFVDELVMGVLPPGTHFNTSSMVELQRQRFLEEMAVVKRQETLDSIADVLSAIVLELREIRAALPQRRKK